MRAWRWREGTGCIGGRDKADVKGKEDWSFGFMDYEKEGGKVI